MTRTMTSPIKYPGAKWRIAREIVSLMPKHGYYLEPYFGSGAVLFNKSASLHETVNDIDGNVVNFFCVCRDYPEELAYKLYLTPFARDEFNVVQEDHAGEEIQLTDDPIENARRFVVRCMQGYGAKLADRVGWKHSYKIGGQSCPRVWNKLPDTVMAVAERLKEVQIDNTDALSLIGKCNQPDCLVYADPPYLGITRSNKRIYRNEMMDEGSHLSLLERLLAHRGMVMLSGYDNDLYNDMLQGWHKEYLKSHTNSGESKTEVLWMNFEHQTRLEV